MYDVRVVGCGRRLGREITWHDRRLNRGAQGASVKVTDPLGPSSVTVWHMRDMPYAFEQRNGLIHPTSNILIPSIRYLEHFANGLQKFSSANT